ncbi:DUF4192 domain-containing protein [Sphaerisporangium rubeum]|uniref:DUF4192 domain-containing protein n=1 Tax=Sphaerisporangium rubeum TaxID=321317 RepID=A0A7X0M750_9ACTN|nr:DUF4192 domain-containing protein [Sphaerisporangium rubeum]MBB6472476.1 hypothetical protein [Sphaerisporangium rubeum]
MTPSPILLTSPEDILGAVPYLLGFHPADSLVVIAFSGRGSRGELRVTTRWDLPSEPGSFDRLVPLFRRERVTHVIVAGFGSGALVTPAVEEVLRLLREAGIDVIEALRADDSRYWSYVCQKAECCPPDGTPYDPVTGPVAARATVNGMVALPGRDHLRYAVSPVEGPPRTAMREATTWATDHLRTRLAPLTGTTTAPPPHPESTDADAAGGGVAGGGMAGGGINGADMVQAAVAGGDSARAAGSGGGVRDVGEAIRVFVGDGLARVRAAIATYAAGDRLSDREAAMLGMDLAVLRVRDEAWTSMGDDTEDAHIALWGDLTRRLEPRFVPPAASLLAAAAWRRGDCALAAVAVERALAEDPAYSMALLVAQGLRQLVSPAILRDRMPTPQDLDDSMGPPRVEWLQPLLTLLEHPRACRPPCAPSTG